MTLIPESKELYHQEDTQFKASMSEALLTKVGANHNFLASRLTTVYEMGATGNYSLAASYPLNDVGSQEVIYGNQRIKNITFIHEVSGSSGTSQFDIKVFRSGSWQSIFTTLPAVTTTAAAGVIFDLIIAAPTGITKPVLGGGFDVLNNGEKIRFDILSTMSGATNPDTINIKIYTTQEN